MRDLPPLPEPTRGPGSPGSLHTPVLQYHSRSRRPLAILTGLLAAGALAAGGLWIANENADPHSITQTHLAGARSPIPVNVNLLLDFSGSFEQFEAIRRRALEQILSWCEFNLRDDDTITVIAFTTDAVAMLQPTTIGNIKAQPRVLTDPAFRGGGTAISGALALTASLARPDHRQSLIVVTDTELGDISPDSAETAITKIGADTMTLILPTGQSITQQWAESFPWEFVSTADNDDPDQTALAIGYAIAHATRQNLEKN